MYEEFEDADPMALRVRPLFINTRELMNENGEGIWKTMMPLEDSIIAASEEALDTWRREGVDSKEMLETEATMARRALGGIKRAYKYLTGKQ